MIFITKISKLVGRNEMLIFENGKSAIDVPKAIRRLEEHTVLQELALLQRKKEKREARRNSKK